MKNEKRFGITGAILVCSLLVALSGCKKSDDVADTSSTSNAPSTSSSESPTSSSDSASVGAKFDDTIITSKVKSALLTDPEIKSLDIKVETNQGAVKLSGFVDNPQQIERSAAVAKSVEGVTNVDNMLALKNGQPTVSSKVDDTMVTTKVKSALLGADDLKSMDISVETNQGNVQLSGFVDNDQQMARAAEVAQSVDGVKAVTNRLSVKK